VGLLLDMGFAGEVLSVGWRQSHECSVVRQRSEVCLRRYTWTILCCCKSLVL